MFSWYLSCYGASFVFNPLPRYTQPKQWRPGNRVLEVSPRFVARHYPWLGKQFFFFTNPDPTSAIWLALAPTITCCRSRETFPLFICLTHRKKQNKEQRYLSFPFPSKSTGYLVSTARCFRQNLCWRSLVAVWDQALDAFQCFLIAANDLDNMAEDPSQECAQVISLLEVHPKLTPSQPPKSPPLLCVCVCVYLRTTMDQRTKSCFVATQSSRFITCFAMFSLPCLIVQVKKKTPPKKTHKKPNADSLRIFLRAKRHFADHRLTSVASACFYSPASIYLRGCLAEVNEVVLSHRLHLLTSPFASATSSRSRGHPTVPPRWRVMNYTEDPSPAFFFFFCSVTILPLTPGPPRCLLWLWWYLRVCRRPRVGTSGIIPQHALAVWVIPTGMSHSPHHPSHQ